MNKIKAWLKTWRTSTFEQIKCLSFQVSKHKWFEIQAGRFDRDCNTLLDFHLNGYHKMSHGGVELCFQIGRGHVQARVYDIRHWDEGNECYEGEKVPFKEWLVEGAKVGPVKMQLDAEMLRIANELCELVDMFDTEEIKQEIPPAEIKRLEERVTGCWIFVLKARQKDFWHVRQEGEE